MAYSIKSLGFGQVAVLQNGKHVKKFGGPSAPTDARMFINKQHQASLPKERAPGLKEHEIAKELEGINNNIGSFTEDMLEQFTVSEINDMIESYESFAKTVDILENKGAKSSKAMAAFIGRKKYAGKKCDEAVQFESIVEDVQFDLNEGLAVHGKYSIKTGPVVRGMGEGSPDHVKAHIGKLNKIGVKADARPGDYGTTHRVVVKNNETGDTTHHHVYQSDGGKKPIMSIRTVGKPRENQDEHHQVLKDYLTGKKPKTETVKESAEDLEEAMRDITPNGAREIIDQHGGHSDFFKLSHNSISSLTNLAKKHNIKSPSSGKSPARHLWDRLHAISQKNESAEYIEEKLTEKDPSSKWIEDFVKSDNPKFAGKSKKERIKMALGAYYGKQNEELDENAKDHYTSGYSAAKLGKSRQDNPYKEDSLAAKHWAKGWEHSKDGKKPEQFTEEAEFDALAEEIAGLFEDADLEEGLPGGLSKSDYMPGAVRHDLSNIKSKKTEPYRDPHRPVADIDPDWEKEQAKKRSIGIQTAAKKLAKESFADQFFDGETIHEEIQIPELQEADKNYDSYFKACMKNAGITSISDLKTSEEKKKFMNKVDAGFKAKNEDMFYENFMRSDIDAKVAQHKQSGNKVDDVTHKVYQGKPYSEFTVTTPDGSKKKFVFHGNVTRHEKLA